MRAAATGRVDFSKARFFDSRWWIYLSWILDEIEAEGLSQLRELRVHKMGYYLASGQTKYESTARLLEDAYQDKVEIAMPWLKDLMTGRKKVSDAQAFEMWKKTWGDINDPRVQEKIDRAMNYFSSVNRR